MLYKTLSRTDFLAPKGFKAGAGLTQSVWSHWAYLCAGNISEAGSITKIAI